MRLVASSGQHASFLPHAGECDDLKTYGLVADSWMLLDAMVKRERGMGRFVGNGQYNFLCGRDGSRSCFFRGGSCQGL